MPNYRLHCTRGRALLLSDAGTGGTASTPAAEQENLLGGPIAAGRDRLLEFDCGHSP